MSDSFADLWSSTTPSKPPPPKLGQSPALGLPSLGNSSPGIFNGRPPPKDLFSTLASTSVTPSPGPSRTITPAGGAGISRTPSAQARGGVLPPGTANGTREGGGTGGDAFSGLGFGSSAGQEGNLTIAQRAARDAVERKARMEQQQAAQKAQAAAWSGLDALGNASAFGPSSASAPKVAVAQHDNDWAFDLPAPVPATTTRKSQVAKSAAKDDDWGLSDAFSSPPQPTSSYVPPPAPTAKTSKVQTIWDLDDLSSPPSNTTSPPQRASPPQTNSPGDFDFGDREDNFDEDSAQEDLLGMGDKPARRRDAPRRPPATQSLASLSPQPARPAPGRSSSPPPHIIGQIVEMGFTPQQARVALAATETGLDVQGALETLLANGAAGPDPVPRNRYDDDDEDEDRTAPARRRPQPGSGRDEVPAPQSSQSLALGEQAGQDDILGIRDIRSAKARRGTSDVRNAPAPRRPQPGSRRPSARDEEPALQSSQSPNLQEQADRLLASASEIGAGLFSKANAFWSQGKERVQRAYEERAAASAGASNGNAGQRRDTPVRDGRPRWMQEAVERDEGDWAVDAEHKPPTRPKPQPNRTHTRSEVPRAGDPERPSRPEVKTGDLFSDDAPAAYVSPFRRRAAASSNAPSPAPDPVPSPAQRVPHAPSPPRLVERQTVSASTSAINTAGHHKAAGTEKFKLGQFAEAEAAYTAALSALPDGHLLRLPLLTNRALARLRTGEHAGAAEDCTAALELVGPSFHPARERKVEDPTAGAGVDLVDGAVKARRRRAEAAEGREKWADARADWEALAGADWAPARVRADAAVGASRCRKMESANAGSGVAAPSLAAAATTLSDLPRVKPRPKGRPTPVRPKPTIQPSGEALARVQAASRAAEAEDEAKHALKDSVDARLLAWRGGKETNLRALLASLDTVLWPELGMSKVGMHELVTPGQVKVKYTRTIARLHPDKLNAGNTTLEQRMIANGVFGALNEAWLAFKQ